MPQRWTAVSDGFSLIGGGPYGAGAWNPITHGYPYDNAASVCPNFFGFFSHDRLCGLKNGIGCLLILFESILNNCILRAGNHFVQSF